jgi:raffinose/stachyose/melibiose transport system substrate-binding protein
MAAVDKAFMKSHPNVKIKRVHQAFNSYFTLLKTATISRRGPDVFENYASPAIWDSYRALTPLSTLLAPSVRQDLSGWVNVSAKNGTPYAIPFGGQGLAIYINTALFQKAGLNPNQQITTWAQLIADCKALKAAGITPIAAGLKDGYYGEWWVDQILPQFQTDAQTTKSITAPVWTTASAAKALDLFASLYPFFTPNSEGIPLFPNGIDEFRKGNAAMLVSVVASELNWSEFRKDPVGKTLAASLFPLVPGSRWTAPRFNYGAGNAVAMASWSKHKPEAAQFLDFLSSPRAQQMVWKMAGMFPNNKIAKATTADPVGNQILGWTRTKKLYVGQATVGLVPAVEPAFDKVVPLVATGQMSSADALKQVQSAQAQAPPIPSK